MNTEMLTQADGEAELQRMESILANGVQSYSRGLLQAAMALYVIRERGLYVFAKDHEGRPITLWNDYVRYISRELDFKRTMLLDAASAIRMLVALGYQRDEIEESAIDLDPIITLKRYIDYDRRTGAIRGVKDQELLNNLPPGDDLQQRIRMAISEISALPNPEERRRYVEDLVGNSDIIRFWGEYDSNGVLYLGWNDGIRSGQFGIDVTPEPVASTIRKLLHIPNYE